MGKRDILVCSATSRLGSMRAHFVLILVNYYLFLALFVVNVVAFSAIYVYVCVLIVLFA